MTIPCLSLATMTTAGAMPVLNFLGTNPLGSTAIVGVYERDLGIQDLIQYLNKLADIQIETRICLRKCGYGINGNQDGLHVLRITARL